MTERKFSQTFDIERAVDAYGLHFTAARTSAERRNIFISMLLVLLGLSYAIDMGNEDRGVLWFLPWILVSVTLAALIAWPPRKWSTIGLRSQLEAGRRSIGAQSEATVYRFDETTLRIEDALFGGQIAWRDVHGWLDSDDLLLIYRGPQFFYYIDKKEVDTEDLQAMRDCLLSSPAKRF